MSAPEKPKKKKTTPQDEGAVRMDGASDKDTRRVVGPRWMNPKEPLPKQMQEQPKPPVTTIVDLARAIAPPGPNALVPSDTLLAGVLIAQALDRLGNNMLRAAAIGRASIVVEQGRK
jgi:hypothetical protein